MEERFSWLRIIFSGGVRCVGFSGAAATVLVYWLVR
jgi:hypothetical protein